MKNLLIQAAKRTGLVNVEQLTSLLDQNAGQGRLDEALLNCPYFTEDVVLKLFAESLGWEYFPEIPRSPFLRNSSNPFRRRMLSTTS